jgi:hypothetical protein
MGKTWIALCKFGVLFLFWFGASVAIGIAYPYFLMAHVIWLPIFLREKSTKVPEDPEAGPASPQIRLSYRDYARWARRYSHQNVPEQYYDRTDVHWTEKMGTLMASREASLYQIQPGSSTLTMTFVAVPLAAWYCLPNIKAAVDAMHGRESLFLQAATGFILAYFSGSASGHFYRWLRGHL